MRIQPVRFFLASARIICGTRQSSPVHAPKFPLYTREGFPQFPPPLYTSPKSHRCAESAATLTQTSSGAARPLSCCRCPAQAIATAVGRRCHRCRLDLPRLPPPRPPAGAGALTDLPPSTASDGGGGGLRRRDPRPTLPPWTDSTLPPRPRPTRLSCRRVLQVQKSEPRFS